MSKRLIMAMGADILVVDDEPEVCAALSNALREFDVTSVHSGDAALAIMRDKTFQLVIADLHMPEMSGIELLERIHAEHPGVPVIVITGLPSMELTIDALRQGAAGFINKPLKRSALLSEIDRIFEDRARMAESLDSDFAAGDKLDKIFESALNKIQMHYQPIYSMSLGKTIGYEALLRSNESKFFGPEHLIDATKEIGRLNDLTRHVHEYIAADYLAMNSGVDLFVNLDPAEFMSDGMLGGDCPLRRYAKSIVFEITERSRLTDKVLVNRTAELRALGYRVAIDDMGAGYAGLNSLVLLSPDFVKLDMALVRGVHHDKKRKDVTEALLGLTRKLGIPVICEGVETTEERDCLVALGADLAQGFLFGSPQPWPYSATSSTQDTTSAPPPNHVIRDVSSVPRATADADAMQRHATTEHTTFPAAAHGLITQLPEVRESSVGGTPVGIALITEEKKFLYANEKFAEIYGCSRSVLDNVDYRSILNDVGVAMNESAFDDLMKGRIERLRMDQQIHRNDGTAVGARVDMIREIVGHRHTCVTVVAEGPHVKHLALNADDHAVDVRGTHTSTFGTSRNTVTTAPRAGQVAHPTKQRFTQLTRADAVKRLFITMAHNYNNLLSVIRSYTELLIDANSDSTTKSHLNSIIDATERGELLNQRLVSFGTHGSTQATMGDVNQAIAQIEPVITNMAGPGVNVTIQLSALPGTAVFSIGDLKQAVINLVNNSLEAMPTGGRIVIKTSREHDAENTLQESVVLSVADTGIGIGDDIERIFDPLYTTKKSQGHIGLGLSFVYDIVERINAHISVESGVGAGTTVRIYLPTSDNANDHEQPKPIGKLDRD